MNNFKWEEPDTPKPQYIQNTQPILLGIDPGFTCTGISLSKIYGKKLGLYNYDFYTEPKKDKLLADGIRVQFMSANIINQIYKIINRYGTSHPRITVCIESVFTGKNPKGVILQSRLLQNLIDRLETESQIMNVTDIQELHPNTVKAQVIRGSANKQEVKDSLIKNTRLTPTMKKLIFKDKNLNKPEREAIFDSLAVSYAYYKKYVLERN